MRARAAAPQARGLGTVALLAAALLLPAGAPAAENVYVHNRWDYAAFRSNHPKLLEPNYLPFMAAWVELPEPAWRRGLRRLLAPLGLTAPPAEFLVFCRWPDDAFPLRVHVVPPRIPDGIEDRLFPRPPGEYVAAVEHALGLWEEGLEGRVRFQLVEDPDEADLRIVLLGAEAPVEDPEVQVLGTTPLGGACQVEGALGPDRLQVRYGVATLRVYVVDHHGLLLPDQVERVALHEIGHALGMHGHSPIPNDLMFRVVRDRLPPDGLGAEDVNSFVSLYSLPSGTVYRRLPAEPEAAERVPREPGPPVLALAPHVNASLGFEVQLPKGWTVVPMGQGVVAVDGVPWDYEAFFQVLVRAYPSLDAYLARYAGAHLGDALLREEREVRVAGRRGLRFVLEREEPPRVEQLTFFESGDGRVLVVIGEAPAGGEAAYVAHFDAILGSLELHHRGPGEAGRDYSPAPR